MAGNFECSWGTIHHLLPADFVTDDCRIGEKVIPPTVISVVVGIDDVADGKIELFFDEIPNFGCFLGHQCINHNRPLRAGNSACRDLGVGITLEPINVFRDAFALHRPILMTEINSSKE